MEVVSQRKEQKVMETSFGVDVGPGPCSSLKFPRGGWSSDAEQSLSEWARRAQVLKRSHLRSAAHFTRSYRILNIPFLVLGALASIGTGGGIFESVMWLRVFSFVMTLLATVLGSVLNFLDYGRLSERHHHTANQYSSFSRDIVTVMLFEPSQRPSLVSVVKELRKKYEDVTERAPLLPNFVTSSERAFQELSLNLGRPVQTDLGQRDLRMSVPVHMPRRVLPPLRASWSRGGRALDEVEAEDKTLPDHSRSLPDESSPDPKPRPFVRISRSVQLSGVRGGSRVDAPPISFAPRNGDQRPPSVSAEDRPSSVHTAGGRR